MFCLPWLIINTSMVGFGGVGTTPHHPPLPTPAVSGLTPQSPPHTARGRLSVTISSDLVSTRLGVGGNGVFPIQVDPGVAQSPRSPIAHETGVPSIISRSWLPSQDLYTPQKLGFSLLLRVAHSIVRHLQALTCSSWQPLTWDGGGGMAADTSDRHSGQQRRLEVEREKQ